MLSEHSSGSASMSAADLALRNAAVHIRYYPEVLRFSQIGKRIALQLCEYESLQWRLSPEA